MREYLLIQTLFIVYREFSAMKIFDPFQTFKENPSMPLVFVELNGFYLFFSDFFLCS